VRLDGVRVLAVDDDPDEAAMMRDVLESAGAHVFTAGSGKGALALLNEEAVDVLLADIGMPEMDGFDLIQRVRRLAGANAAVPATAITAYTRSDDRDRALASGFDQHVSKPIDPSDLLTMVHRLVTR